MSPRDSLAAAAMAGLLLLGGCGDAPGYDASAVEAHLVTRDWQVFGGAEVERASCPDDRALREGMVITCELAIGEARLPYLVILTDVHADEVDVSAAPDGVLMSGTEVTRFVRTRMPDTATGASVDCGGDWFVAKVGESRTCTLRLGSQEKPITVKVRTETGVVTISS